MILLVLILSLVFYKECQTIQLFLEEFSRIRLLIFIICLDKDVVSQF